MLPSLTVSSLGSSRYGGADCGNGGGGGDGDGDASSGSIVICTRLIFACKSFVFFLGELMNNNRRIEETHTHTHTGGAEEAGDVVTGISSLCRLCPNRAWWKCWLSCCLLLLMLLLLSCCCCCMCSAHSCRTNCAQAWNVGNIIETILDEAPSIPNLIDRTCQQQLKAAKCQSHDQRPRTTRTTTAKSNVLSTRYSIYI